MQSKELSLHHLIRTPRSGSDKAPCLMMLHGYGSNEEDLFSFASELPEELFIVSARAPYELMPYGYAWYSIHFDNTDGKWSDDAEAIASRELIAQFIDEVVETYPVDAENMTLLGFSQGTILSYATALSYPEKVKNVIGLSGYVNTAILNENPEHYGDLSVYGSHGTLDQVIPIEWARKTPAFLEARNIDFVFEEYPAGHGVIPQNFYAFKAWLEDKLKN